VHPFSITAAGRRTTGWRSGPASGVPAVLLHGVPTGAMLWSRLPAQLPDRALIALDLPGYGGTEALAHPDVAAHLGWLAASLGALGLTGPLHLVGQDLGGLIAAEHAARAGAASLTLTSAPAGLLWLVPRLTATPPLHRYFYERHSGALYLRRGIQDAERSAFLAEFAHVPREPGLSAYMRQTALAFSARALWRLPARLRGVRSLCLWGAADPFCPPITASWTARSLGADVVFLPGGRHYVPFGRPRAYAAALASFWAGGEAA